MISLIIFMVKIYMLLCHVPGIFWTCDIYSFFHLHNNPMESTLLTPILLMRKLRGFIIVQGHTAGPWQSPSRICVLGFHWKVWICLTLHSGWWVVNEPEGTKRGSTRLMTWSRRTILMDWVWSKWEWKKPKMTRNIFDWGIGWIKTFSVIAMQIFDRGILCVRLQREGTWFQYIFIHKCLHSNSTCLPWGRSQQHTI